VGGKNGQSQHITGFYLNGSILYLYIFNKNQQVNNIATLS
jgi:hypothetical protein